MPPTLSMKLILLSATICSSPRSFIWVFTAWCYSLLLWDVNCNCLADGSPNTGEDSAPLAGGFPNRLLPPPYGPGRGGPGCHPTPRCDRCHSLAQSGARTLGIGLPGTTEVRTRASRLQRAANLRASAPLASRSGGVFPGKHRGLVIQGTQ